MLCTIVIGISVWSQATQTQHKSESKFFYVIKFPSLSNAPLAEVSLALSYKDIFLRISPSRDARQFGSGSGVQMERQRQRERERERGRERKRRSGGSSVETQGREETGVLGDYC